MSEALTVVIDLPFLAREVNEAHHEVGHHARSMLMEAKRAGEALLAAKRLVPHGQFRGWVERNCRCGYRQARKYMAVSKVASQGHFEGGIDAFLEAHAKPRLQRAAVPSFTRDDAEYALKLAAMADRGTGPEKAVAASKLEAFAKGFSMEPSSLRAAAAETLPDQGLTPREAADRAAAARLGEAEARIAELTKQLEALAAKRAEIRASVEHHSRDELIDMLVNALLQIEGTNP